MDRVNGKQSFTNATLVMRDHLIPDAFLSFADGIITSFGKMKDYRPDGEDVIDAEGAYLGPGLIDIHTHAAGQITFIDDPVTCAQHHLSQGTTSVMPATYFAMTKEEFLSAIDTIRRAMDDPRCANIAGIYMEGPYLNPKFGCDKENNPWKGPVKKEDYQPIIDAATGVAKVWATAPEREGILEYVLAVKEKNPDAVFTVAHSEASPQQIEALMPYGLKIGTHHTNATGDRVFYPEVRGVCVDETVNYHSEIYAELICDSVGIHVDPFMLRLVRKIKGEERIILISDAYAADGPIPEGYDGVYDINFDWEGEIAGSKLTLNVACRNMMVHTGASIVDVFRYASTNPARAVGFFDRGEIQCGKRADLVLVDNTMNVQKVVLKGKVQ